MAEIERMLGLYRDLYRGFTVKHFHEQLGKRHGSNSKFRFRGYFRSFVSLSGWVLGGTGEARGQGGRSAAAAMDCSRWDQSRKTT